MADADIGAVSDGCTAAGGSIARAVAAVCLGELGARVSIIIISLLMSFYYVMFKIKTLHATYCALLDRMQPFCL